MDQREHAHFQGKDALAHVLDAKKQAGMGEPHGFQLPGPLFAALDTARHLSVLYMLLFALVPNPALLALFSLAALIAYAGRSAWLGWSTLERLHRSLEQEHYEIEHHRGQEREELKALYAEKGFQGALLEQVVDVLMADEDRLLKVMLEEEMGLSLESHEHPLKHAAAAFIGGAIPLLIAFLATLFLPSFFVFLILFALMAAAAGIAAWKEKNMLISSIIWSLAIAGLSLGVLYSTMRVFGL